MILPGTRLKSLAEVWNRKIKDEKCDRLTFLYFCLLGFGLDELPDLFLVAVGKFAAVNLGAVVEH